MAIRIEIARTNKLLELRIGDLDGCTTFSNFTMEEVMSEIEDEISKMTVKEIVKESGVKDEN